MKISDMIELGFDPTRLREYHHEGKDYILERISPGLLASIEKIRNLLRRISSSISETRFHNTAAFVNPPLAIFRDRGNAYNPTPKSPTPPFALRQAQGERGVLKSFDFSVHAELVEA
jgi:hypothetical protein